MGVAQQGKAPIVVADLRAILARLPKGPLGLRDRALLLLGFAGGFRRSELVALDVADLAFTSEGITVTIRRSKTDQEGQGRKVGIPSGRHVQTCPVLAVRDWLEESDMVDGAVFRPVLKGGRVCANRLSAQSVNLVVKRAAASIGLDPTLYGGHSLRAGLATAAASAGASERSIAQQTGHRSMKVLRGYIRDGSLYRDNAASIAGL